MRGTWGIHRPVATATARVDRAPAHPQVRRSFPVGVRFGFLVALCALVYSVNIRAPFNFDDLPKIVRNPDIKDLSRIGERLVYPYTDTFNFTRNDPSRPVVYLTFALNYHVGGLDPLGYRMVNVGLHAANAFLIFLLIRRLLRDVGADAAAGAAFAAAALFAIHPLNTSTVSYVFSRSDLLLTFFYLAALLLFIRASDTGNRVWYAGTIVCGVLALLSKQSAVTLPAAALLVDWLFIARADVRSLRSRGGLHAGLWVLAAGYFAWRIAYFGGVGDREAAAPWPRIPYALSQPYALVRYLQFFLVPIGLCIDHGIAPVRSAADPRFWLGVGVCGCIGWLVWRAWCVRRAWSPIVLLAVGWVLIGLSPTSSVFPTSAVVVENRTYLAFIGLYVGVAYVLLRTPWPHRGVVTAVLGVVLGSMAVARNAQYNDLVVLWGDVVRLYPANPRARCALGERYFARGEYDRAIEQYREAIRHHPLHVDAHNNLALVYSELGRHDEAVHLLETARTLNPTNVKVLYNLGTVYYRMRNARKALEYYAQVEQLTPRDAQLHKDIANVHYSQRCYDQAERHYRTAISLNPSLTDAYFELGTLYLELGRYREAVETYEAGIIRAPADERFYTNLAAIHERWIPDPERARKYRTEKERIRRTAAKRSDH
jgi:Flp pilus assembly protein TadD